MITDSQSKEVADTIVYIREEAAKRVGSLNLSMVRLVNLADAAEENLRLRGIEEDRDQGSEIIIELKQEIDRLKDGAALAEIVRKARRLSELGDMPSGDRSVDAEIGKLYAIGLTFESADAIVAIIDAALAKTQAPADATEGQGFSVIRKGAP